MLAVTRIYIYTYRVIILSTGSELSSSRTCSLFERSAKAVGSGSHKVSRDKEIFINGNTQTLYDNTGVHGGVKPKNSTDLDSGRRPEVGTVHGIRFTPPEVAEPRLSPLAPLRRHHPPGAMQCGLPRWLCMPTCTSRTSCMLHLLMSHVHTGTAAVHVCMCHMSLTHRSLRTP